MAVNFFDNDLSSIESSSCRERRYSEDDRVSEQETVIKSLTYAVQVSESCGHSDSVCCRTVNIPLYHLIKSS